MSIKKIYDQLKKKGDESIDQCDLLYAFLVEPFIDFDTDTIQNTYDKAIPSCATEISQKHSIELSSDMFEM